MISDPTFRARRPDLLLWGFILSLLLHAAFLSAMFWAFKLQLPWAHERTKPERLFVVSSALRIQHRTVPQRPRPPQRTTPQVQPVRPVAPQPQYQPQRRPQPQPTQARRELVQIASSAPPVPTPHPSSLPQTLAAQLARQQQLYQREVAQLRQQNNPLSVATISPRPPSSYRRSYVDIGGVVNERRELVEGILTPINHWFTGPMSCYYTRYAVQFSTGGSEQGYIPWPVCYPRDHDVMVNPPWAHLLPLPVPPVGYVLPDGTYLTPLLREIYDQRPR